MQPGQSPLGTNLIPRDYLSSRSDGQSSRKVKPSPLQSSHVPQPSHSEVGVSEMPSKSRTDVAQPVQSSGTISKQLGGPPNGHPGSEQNQPNGLEAMTMQKTRNGNEQHRGLLTQSPQPDSPTSTTSSVKSEHPQTRMQMPRNSSIDSAISTLSSNANQSTNTSAGNNPVTEAEIRNLVQTAGSAENLIVHLLREKRHSARENTQLWDVVRKQRELLLGLNKDLEKLASDKERYKRKLKEYQSHPPPLPRAHVQGHSGPSESQVSGLTRSASGKQQEDRSHDIDNSTLQTPDKKPMEQIGSSPLDPAMMPSPLHMLQMQRQVQSSMKEPDAAGHTFTKSADLPAEPVNIPAASTALPDLDHDNESYNERPVDQAPAYDAPPAFTLSAPTPLTEKGDRTFPSTKRPKPAPLKLNQPNRGSMMVLDMQEEEHSDSDCEDVLNQDEDRGRRKTREDDDREREETAKVESQARSRSKKSKLKALQQSQSDVVNTELPAPRSLPNGLPLSPRPVTSQPQSDSDERLLSPEAGMTATQAPGSEQSTSQRMVTLPPRSPGLPVSPRPTDRPMGLPAPRPHNSLPLSPRGMPAGRPLSPRAPKQPLPQPQYTPLSSAFPEPPSGIVPPYSVAPTLQPSQLFNEPPASPTRIPEIYRGFVDSRNHPDLLLPPNALPSIFIKVASPRLRPSRHSLMSLKPQEDAPVFMISVFARHNGQELWRAEKVILSLPQLDQQFSAVCKTSARLPDRRLFAGHSPAVVDARRAALDTYFNDLLDSPMNEKAALTICHFLSTDVIEPSEGENPLDAALSGRCTLTIGPDGRPRKEGYLTKRGKNFGGWKARFFVLHGPDLRYFEAPGGAHLGTIKLLNAQIGKQSASESPAESQEDAENQYRHAFLILEPKRRDSSSLMRHVLCAESDQERDEWVSALLRYVDDPNEEGPAARAYAMSSDGNLQGDASQLKAIPYADTALGATPLRKNGAMVQWHGDNTPSPTSTSSATTPQSVHQNDEPPLGSVASKSISGPVNGGVIQDAGAWGNKPATTIESKDHKKKGMWGFRHKSSSDLLFGHEHSNSTNSTNSDAVATTPTESKTLVRAVFGLPLAEAVELCPPKGIDSHLPAVVYRSIEYLRAKNAASEEGIFRLSGSSIVVRAMRERFNTEGDVNLLGEGQYHDIHAVASLFKTYLRELPTTILTKELHLEFLHVLELEDKPRKISAFNSLVHRLPLVNYALLRALSQYLLEVVNNSDKNKMSMRNVGIVFSPTLNIPAPVFSMFLSDFDAIFGDGEAEEPGTGTQEVTLPSNNLNAGEIRSPRHQMFSDIPTPAYNQTSFSNGPPPSSYRPSPTMNTQQDVGFIPMQPSYENRQYISNPYAQNHQHSQRYPAAPQVPQPAQGGEAEYGSLNMMMSPNNAPTLKAKRRESSMLFMGMGNRQSSYLDVSDG